MLWKALKNKIVQFVDQNPDHKGAQDIKTVAEGMRKTVPEILENYDVRNIGLLRDLVPEAFPKKMRQGPLVACTNIYQAWRVNAFTAGMNMSNKMFL